MTDIAPSQCRAARGLLKWSQPDLARHADVHVQTICAFENETGTPTKRTLQKLISAYENAGVEFSAQEGVRRNSYSMRVFRGVDGFQKFYDEIYDVAKTQGGEFCVNNVSEDIFDKWHASPERLAYHLDRMAAVMQKDPTFNMRIIIEEGDKNFKASTYATYRWASKEDFADISFYVYGDCLGILIFEEEDVYINVIPNRRVATAYRKQFDLAWDAARDPEQ